MGSTSKTKHKTIQVGKPQVYFGQVSISPFLLLYWIYPTQWDQVGTKSMRLEFAKQTNQKQTPQSAQLGFNLFKTRLGKSLCLCNPSKSSLSCILKETSSLFSF